MGLVNRLMGLFSGGSEESRLKKGMDLAKAGKPESAIAVYDALLASTKDDDLKARTLLNRALSFSALVAARDCFAVSSFRAFLANTSPWRS